MKTLKGTAPREFANGFSVLVAQLKEHVDAFGAMCARQSAYFKSKAFKYAQETSTEMFRMLRKLEQSLPEPPEDDAEKKKRLTAHCAPGGALKPAEDAQSLWARYQEICDKLEHGEDTLLIWTTQRMTSKDAGEFRFFLLRVIAATGFQPLSPEELRANAIAEVEAERSLATAPQNGASNVRS